MYLSRLDTAALPQNAATCFADAARVHPALDQVGSPDGVLDLLGRRGKKDYALRDAVLLAVLAQYQATAGGVAQVWSFLLLKSFLPMLGSMTRTVRVDSMSREERESLVAQGFLEAARRFDCTPGRSHVAYALRMRVWEAVLALRGQEESYDERSVPMEEEDLEQELLERGCFDRGPLHFQDQLAVSAPELRTLLFRWLGGAFPEEHLDLIADTVLSGKEVSEYIRERLADGSPADRRLAEKRVRTAKDRILQRVRTELQARFARDRAFARCDPANG